METGLTELFEELDQGPAARVVSLVSSSPAPDAQPAQVIKKPLAERRRQEKLEKAKQRERSLRAIESEMLEKSIQISMDCMRFAEVEPDSDEPPGSWVRELGYDKAMERLKLAKSGWMNKKEAPIGVQIAQVIAVGIIRSRATEKAGPRTLNVQMVQMSAPLPTFPELELPEKT